MFGRIASGDLRERSDVILREQKIVAQRILGTEEVVISRGVPCNIQQVFGSRLATMLGFETHNQLIAHFHPEPRIKTGYVVRVMVGARQFRYVVKSVEKYPAPHDFQFQVATLTQELMHTRA